ncbi:MAG: amino acid adenylation domain-containing protein [Pseudomonadales bacterium]|nr:amino acid adenylation domain-containing protein [Pseudomonadales bacterium]
MSTDKKNHSPAFIQHTVLAVWSDIAVAQRISYRTVIRDLGVSSIQLTQFRSELMNTLGVNLKLEALYTADTIEDSLNLVLSACNHPTINHPTGENRLGTSDSDELFDTLQPISIDTVSKKNDTNWQPLTPAQNRLYFLYLLNRTSPAYHISGSLIFENVDSEILKQAFTILVNRHPNLHSIFDQIEGDNYSKEKPFETSFYCASSLEIDTDEAFDQWFSDTENKHYRTPFNLQSEYPIRISHYTLKRRGIEIQGIEKQVIFVNVHHIACDGWSVDILRRELDTLLTGLTSNLGSDTSSTTNSLTSPETLLPTLPQNSPVQPYSEENNQTSVDYWIEKLSGAPLGQRLPPHGDSIGSSNIIVMTLPQNLNHQVQLLTEKLAISESAFYFTAFQFLLATYVQRDDICIGMPVADRSLASRPTVGMLVNSVILRNENLFEKSAKTVLEENFKLILESLQYHRASFEQVISGMPQQDQKAVQQGCYCSFSLEATLEPHSDSIDITLGSKPCQLVFNKHVTPKTDLAMTVVANQNQFLMEFDNSRFNTDYIQELSKQFRDILQWLMSNPEKSIKQRPMSGHQSTQLTPSQLDFYYDSLFKGPDTNTLGYLALANLTLNESLWRKALHYVEKCNPALRNQLITTDYPGDAGIVQKPRESGDLALTVLLYGDHDITRDTILERSKDFIYQDYELVNAALVQYIIIEIDPGYLALICSCHHLMLDGVSLALHGNKVVEVYSRLNDFDDFSSSDDYSSSDEYNDFNERAKRFHDETDSPAALAYWRHYLQEHEPTSFPVPPLSSRHNISEQNSSENKTNLRNHQRFTECSQVIGEDRWKPIARYCRQNKITPMLYFQGLFAFTLYQLAQNNHSLVIKNVLAGRSGLKDRGFGCFLHQVPVLYRRDLFQSDDRIADVFAFLRQDQKSRKKVSMVSLRRLAGLYQSSGLQFSFNYYHFTKPVDIAGSAIDYMPFPTLASDCVQFVAQVMEKGVSLKLMYETSQFQDFQLLDRLVAISDQIVKDEVETWGDVDILLESDRYALQKIENRVLANLSNRSLALPNSVCSNTVISNTVNSVADLFTLACERYGDEIALVDGDHQFTYRQLASDVLKLTTRLNEIRLNTSLQELSVDDNQPPMKGLCIALCMEKSSSVFISMLSILKSGCCYVPIDPNWPADRKQTVLQDCGIRYLIVDDETENSLAQLCASLNHNCEVLSFRNIHAEKALRPTSLPTISANSPAYIIYTSGTTGVPKGVVVQHGPLLETYVAWKHAYSLGLQRQNHLQMANTAFDVCTGDWIRALCSGDTLVLCDQDTLMDGVALYRLLCHTNISFAEFVPAVLRHLLDYLDETKSALPPLNTIVVGSDMWYRADLERLKKHTLPNTRLINSYGLTEACIDTTFYSENTFDSKTTIDSKTIASQVTPLTSVIPIGQAFDHHSLLVLNTFGRVAPFGTLGELWVTGRLAAGYLNHPIQTAERFRIIKDAKGNDIRGYKTGDIVQYNHEGQLQINGRSDHQIKIRGFRVELNEIEEKIKEHAAVSLAIVVAVDKNASNDNPVFDYELRAFVALVNDNDVKDNNNDLKVNKKDLNRQKENTPDTITESILSFIAGALPETMLPTHITKVDKWPLTNNGKIDRKALLLWNVTPGHQDFITTNTEVEVRLLNIWECVLGQEPLLSGRDFFQLGGHSLLVARLSARIKDEFGLQISLRFVFEHPGFLDMANHITRSIEANDTSQSLNNTKSSVSILVPPKLVPIVTEDNDSPFYPLSYNQERMWFLDQLSPRSGHFNIPTAIRLQGKMNVRALERAFKMLRARHESLRTRIVEMDGTGWQVIDAPQQDWQVRIEDYTQSPKSTEKKEDTQKDIIARVMDHISKDCRYGFDVATDDLFRVSFYLIGRDEQAHEAVISDMVISICLHHIVADGWSIKLIQSELMQLYIEYKQDYSEDADSLLDNHHLNGKPALQYKDFSVWQKEYLQGEALQQKIEFWRSALHDFPHQLNLPDLPHMAAISSLQRLTQTIMISDATTEKVRQYCGENASSPFMYYLAAYSLLVSRFSQSAKLTIGVPTAGRDLLETEDIVGLFVNGVVIPITVDETTTVKDYLNSCKDLSLQSFSNQDVPLDVLAESLGIDRSSGKSNGKLPGSQIGFNYQDFQLGEEFNWDNLSELIDGTEVAPIGSQFTEFDGISGEAENADLIFDLQLVIWKEAGSFKASLHYKSNKFDISTAKLLATGFEYLIDNLYQSGDKLISELSTIPQADYLSMIGVEQSQIDYLIPLTYMQKQIVMGQQLKPDNSADNHGYLVYSREPFDLDRIALSIERIIQQEPMLRARVVEGDWRFGDDLHFCIENAGNAVFSDLLEFKSCPTRSSADQYIKSCFEIPFDLNPKNSDASRYGLCRYIIVDIPQETQIFVFVCHHALLDGYSAQLHGQQMAEQCFGPQQAFSVSDRPILNLQNYNAECAATHALEADPADEAYWQQQFSQVQALPVLKPPQLDLDKSLLKSSELLKSSSLMMDKELSLDIRQYCRQKRITSAIFYKLLYGMVLNRLIEPEGDFPLFELDMPFSKRKISHLGCYLRKIPFVFQKSALDNEQPISDTWIYLKSEQKKRKPHLDVSDAYLDKLADTTTGFLFNLITYIPDEQHNNQRTLIEEISNRTEQAQFRIKILKNTTKLEFLYRDDQFTDAHFLRRVVHLAKQIIHDDQRSMASIDILLEGEAEVISHQLIGENQPIQNTTVANRIAEQFRQNPLKDAIIFEQQSWTYGDLQNASENLAVILREKGVQESDRVAVHLPRSPKMVAALLATWQVGAAYVPLAIDNPPERNDRIITDVLPVLVITHSTLRSNLPENEIAHLCLDTLSDDSLLASPAPDLSAPILSAPDLSVKNKSSQYSANNTAYILYTSGSTGTPKGAQISHKNLNNLLDHYQRKLAFTSENSMLALTAIAFDIAGLELWMPLMTGAKIVMANDSDTRDGEAIAALMDTYQITTIQATPATWQLIMMTQWRLSPDNRKQNVIGLCGGEALNASLANQILERNLTLYNVYGPTETTIWSSDTLVTSELIKNTPTVTIGKAIQNTQLYILDNKQRMRPAGCIGELYIGGDGVGQGYLNRDELNTKYYLDSALLPDYFPRSSSFHESSSCEKIYRTGDKVRLNQSGLIDYLGRMDHQVKVRGIRFELGEVETALTSQDAVSQAAVLLKERQSKNTDSKGERNKIQQLTAYLTWNKSISAYPDKGQRSIDDPTLKQLKDTITNQLPPSMLPHHYIVMDKMPLTISGKIDRKKLAAIEPAPIKHSSEKTTETEKILAGLWSKLISLKTVWRDDDFFELGGHSLLVVKLVALIKESFNIKLPLTVVFSNSVLHELATIIDNIDLQTVWSPIVDLSTLPPDHGAETSDEHTIVMIHPVSGSIFNYKNLAHQFSGTRCVGIQAYGMEDGQTPLQDQHVVAMQYIKEMKAQHINGPIVLLGHSMGGLIALEMANQIEQQPQEGLSVQMVGLIDTYYPSDDMKQVLSNENLLSQIFKDTPIPKMLGLTADELAEKSDTLLRIIYQKLVMLRILNDDIGFSEIERRLSIHNAMLQIAQHFRIPQVHVPLYHYRAKEPLVIDGQNMLSDVGWNQDDRLEMNFRIVAGNHETILQQHNAQGLYEKLDYDIKRAVKESASFSV